MYGRLEETEKYISYNDKSLFVAFIIIASLYNPKNDPFSLEILDLTPNQVQSSTLLMKTIFWLLSFTKIHSLVTFYVSIDSVSQWDAAVDQSALNGERVNQKHTKFIDNQSLLFVFLKGFFTVVISEV